MRRRGKFIKRASAGDGCRIRRQLRCDRANEAVVNMTMKNTSSTAFARKDILMIPRKGHEI
jgi:aspartate carbamoyltransferase regulatory subunit